MQASKMCSSSLPGDTCRTTEAVRLLRRRVDGSADEFPQVAKCAQLTRDPRMAKDPDALDIVVELLLRQRAYDRRDLAQTAIAIFLRKVHLEIEFDLAL